jgi:RNA polymerase-binding transcription factor DksA
MAKSVTKTKAKPAATSKTPAKPAAKAVAKKPAPKPVAKKAPVKAAAKPAKPAKPSPKAAKPAAKKVTAAPAKKPAAPAPKVLVKKTAPVSKGDKPVSVRTTRGKETKSVSSKDSSSKGKDLLNQQVVFPDKNPHSKTFLNLQRQRLLLLKDDLVDSMTGMASETLRSRAQDSEASAFGMHQADAGSDAYDRDFTLSLLSQEQDALYEIEEALKRLDKGTYGICEISAKTIPVERLEVRPYARYTVECQEQVDRELGPNSLRRGIRSLFGLGTDEDDEDGDEDSVEDDKN